MKKYYMYILANRRDGILYIGTTNDIIRRIYQHKNNEVSGFTKRYKIHQLVYYEECSDIREVILREKRMKKWKRQWKIELIEKSNPEWRDLYNEIIG